MSLLKLKSSNKVINTIFNFKESFKAENINDLLLIELDDLETFFDKRDDNIKSKIIELRNNKACKKEILEKLAELLNIKNFEINNTTIEVDFETDIKTSFENDKNEIYFSSNEFKCNEKLIITKPKCVIGKGNDKTAFILNDLEINTCADEPIIFQDCNLEGINKINYFNVLNGVIKFINVNFNNLIICSKGNSKLEFENCKFFNLKDSIQVEDNSSINFINLKFEKQDQSQIILRNNARIDNDLKIKFKNLILDLTETAKNKFLKPYTVEKGNTEKFQTADITISGLLIVKGTLVFDSCSLIFNNETSLTNFIELMPGSELVIRKCIISVKNDVSDSIFKINRAKFNFIGSKALNIKKIINIADGRSDDNMSCSSINLTDSFFENVPGEYFCDNTADKCEITINNCTFNGLTSNIKNYTHCFILNDCQKILINNSNFINLYEVFWVIFEEINIVGCNFTNSRFGSLIGETCNIENSTFFSNGSSYSSSIVFSNHKNLKILNTTFKGITLTMNPPMTYCIIDCCSFVKGINSNSLLEIDILGGNCLSKFQIANCTFEENLNNETTGNLIDVIQRHETESKCVEINKCKFIGRNHAAIKDDNEFERGLIFKEKVRINCSNSKDCTFVNCYERD